MSRNGAASSSRSASRRFVLQLHDLRRVDHRTAAQRDDLVRLVEVQRLHSLRDDLDVGLGVGNDRHAHLRLRRKRAPDDVDVADLLQRWIGDDEGRARREVAQVLHRVHVEVDLIGNSEPHMGWRPSRHALDVQVVIDVDVVGGAVAAAGAAAERERRHHVVVDAAQRANRSRRIHDDAPGIDHLAELADDLVIVREDDCGMSEPADVVHIHADLQRLLRGLGPINRQHRETASRPRADTRGPRP